MQPTTTSGRRGAKAYLAAVVSAQVFGFLRYTLLARILGPEQLGLAATLVVTAQFFEWLTDNGSDRFLIQDADGDAPPVQNLVQGVFFVRGLFTAAALMIFAGAVATFYHVPQLASGIRLLALWPLIFGCLHMDMRRAQRRNDFRTEALGVFTSEAVSVVVTVLVAWRTRSFTAPVFGLIARSLALVLVSHLRAERPYRLGYARDAAARLARFAAPLIVNGWLLFMGSQTDRVLVAHQLGAAELGRYSAVLLLIFYPSASISRYLGAMHLPRIATARGDVHRRDEAAGLLGGQVLLLALAMAAGFAVVAPLMVVVLYGPKFAQPAMIVGLIGILQAARFMRIWPTTVALGLGKSAVVLANNIVRLAGLPIAIAGVAWIGGLAGVAAGFIVGEMAALAGSVLLLNRVLAQRRLRDLDRVLLFILASATIIAWTLVMRAPSVVEIAALGCGSALLAAWIVRRERAAIGEALTLAGGLMRSRPVWGLHGPRDRRP